MYNVEFENENFNKCIVKTNLINYGQSAKFKIYGMIKIYIFANEFKITDLKLHA